MNDDQKAVFEKVRENTAARMAKARPEYDDSDVYRFCVARKFDVNKATDMLNNHLTWTEQKNIHALVEECRTSDKYKFLREYIPHCYEEPYGVDKEGLPYFYERGGMQDPRGLFTINKHEEFVNFHIYMMESCRYAKKLGRPITGTFHFADMGGCGYHTLYKPGIDAAQEWMKLDEAHYPETIKGLFIIRTPRIFTVLWNMFKPILDPNTVAKMKLLGYEYKDEVLRYIDASQLPQELGFANPKPWRSCGAVSGKDGSETVTVSKKHEVHVDVKEASEVGTTVFYEFHTASGDIGFGVFRGTESLEPLTRYDCAGDPAQGKFVCPAIGRYTLTFDNSHSWVSSKRLTYKVSAILPSRAKEEYY